MITSGSVRQRIEYKDKAKSPRLSTRQVQIALKKAGYYHGAVDGNMGLKTKEAVKSFQKANGLKADGVIGKKTLEKLNRYLSR